MPFIGANKVWQSLGAQGQGMTVALVDTGIDYTHKDFGGSGDPADYANNDPNVIEPGTFPTKKVIGGYDFVGSNYDVVDDDPTNDIPRPDSDPLDRDGHGTHTGGTCCGIGVPGKIGPGVAPKVEDPRVQGLGRGQLDRRRARGRPTSAPSTRTTTATRATTPTSCRSPAASTTAP